ncbi:MAG TPA: (d)CMP kinase [Actinocrinis sp.]
MADSVTDRLGESVAVPITLAIDGPSGSGKSSVSRAAAIRLGLQYLDTGAQYRAMTWWMLQHGVDVADRAAVAAACDKPSIESGTDPLDPAIAVDGRSVAGAVRTPEVTAAVSAVAGVQAVRDQLIALQRLIIRQAREQHGGIVVEGRDIADVVCPAAECKIYLTASVEARAARRNMELVGGPGAAQTGLDLARRDAEDAKTTRPLDAAPGAIVVDATDMTLDQVVDRVAELAAAARG